MRSLFLEAKVYIIGLGSQLLGAVESCQRPRPATSTSSLLISPPAAGLEGRYLGKGCSRDGVLVARPAHLVPCKDEPRD